jgi:uncharacterized protein YciI
VNTRPVATVYQDEAMHRGPGDHWNKLVYSYKTNTFLCSGRIPAYSRAINFGHINFRVANRVTYLIILSADKNNDWDAKKGNVNSHVKKLEKLPTLIWPL